MAKPFKFRYVSEIAGGFVLLVVVLLVAGIFAVGRAQGWFEPRMELRVDLPPEGSYGLQEGAEVRILGTPAGTVEELEVNDDGSMSAVLELRGRFVQFVRADSEAILKKQFEVAGDTYIELTRGTGAPLDDNKLPEPARKDTELTEKVEVLVEQFRQTVVPLIEKIQEAVEEYASLARGFQEPDGHFQQLLGRLAGIAKDLQEGRGPAGKLLSDPETAAEIDEAVSLVNESLEQIRLIVQDVKAATAELPETAWQARSAIDEAQKLIEGVQSHWLLRGSIEQEQPLETIEPAAVGAPGGAE